MNSSRYPLPKNTWVRFNSGRTFCITDEPIGYGGSSLIYPVKEIIDGKMSSLMYAIKEVYPSEGCERIETGQIIGITDKDKMELQLAKDRVMCEKDSVAALYNSIHEIVPVRAATDKAEISFESDIRNFSSADNVFAFMDDISKKGISVNSLISRTLVFPFGRALSITAELVRIIAKVHESGWLHLDISDGNVFVAEAPDSDKESVFLLDFGCAREMENDGYGFQAITIRDVIYSTPGFISPEMYERKDGAVELSDKTDVFSVGCLLYKMLTGQEYVDYGIDEEINLDADLYMTACPSYLYSQVKQLLEGALCRNCEFRSSISMVQKQIADINNCIAAFRNYDYYDLFHHAAENGLTVDIENIHFSQRRYKDSVDRLEADLLLNADSINLKLCDAIFVQLRSISQQEDIEIEDVKKWSETLSSLLCTGIAISNHLGKGDRAKILFEELEPLKCRSISFGQAVNRIAVTYSDEYQYEEALDLISKNIDKLEQYKSLLEQWQGETHLPDLSRAYSAKGTYLALLKREGPLEWFNKAITGFGTDDQANCDITRCHILHYAIDIRDMDLYERTLNELFRDGTNSIEKHYENMKINNSDPHQIWAFMKGIRFFYHDQISEEFWKRMWDDFYSGYFDKVFQGVEYRMTLIFRYLFEIEYSRNGKTVIMEKLYDKAIECCKWCEIREERPIDILMCFNYVTSFVYNSLTGRMKENFELCNRMRDHAARSGWDKMVEFIDTKKTLDGILTFEYC